MLYGLIKQHMFTNKLFVLKNEKEKQNKKTFVILHATSPVKHGGAFVMAQA